MKFEPEKDIKRVIVICAASVIMALNIKTFVRTGGLFPGGATGLTLLFQRAGELFFHVEIPYTVLNVAINAVPVYIGFRFIGKKFSLFSCLSIVLTSVLTDILPGYVITYDTLLIAVFGGMVNGLAISMCLAVNATMGGTDFIAIYLSEKKGIDAFNMVLGLNVVILCLAGALFGWEKALYSIIFQYASTQVLHVLYKKYQQRTLLVVTDHARAVYEAISRTSHHGATVLEGEGSYAHRERKVVYSVVSSAEQKDVVRAIKKADPHAFTNVLRTERIAGRFYLKPNE